MERKDNRWSASQGALDPLVWLKRELLREGEAEFADELIRELDALTERLRKNSALRLPADDSALEAFVEMLPSESLTDDFLDSVNERRKARGNDPSPAVALREMRMSAGVSLLVASEALGIPVAELESVESAAVPWHRLPVARFGEYAAVLRKPVGTVIDRLKRAAKCYLLGQVESRMQLALGRYDKAQRVAQARLDSLRTALEMMKDENKAALIFFGRLKRTVGPQ